MIKQKFPYWEWEDYCAGLYMQSWGDSRTAADSIAILADLTRLDCAMRRAVAEYPKAAAHHLTDGGMNQRAWLGWAACGIERQVPAHITRAAWWQLSEPQRIAANAVADNVIASYMEAGRAQAVFIY